MEKLTTTKTLFILITIILAITVIRSSGLDIPILDDETNYVEWIDNPGPLITPNPFKIHPHPPLGGWLFFAAGKIFNQSTWGFRLVPLLLSSLNIFLLFILTKNTLNNKNQKNEEHTAKIENEANKTALLAITLLSISYYATLMALQIDIEGSILVTTYLLMTIFYQKGITKLQKYKNIFQINSQFIIAGICFGLALLTKTNAILFGGIIGIHLIIINTQSLIKTHITRLPNPKEYLIQGIKTIIQGSQILIPGIIMFLSLAILNKDIFSQVFAYSSSVITPNISILAIIMLTIWATPLFLSLSLLQMLKKDGKDLFFTLWLCIYAGVFIFLIAGRPGSHDISGGIADYSRYFMNLMIPLAYLSARFINSINWTKQKIKKIIIPTTLILLSMFIINYKTNYLITREFSSYLQEILSGNTHFFFSFFTSSGNLLLANMGILIISTLVIAFSTTIFLMIKNKHTKIAKMCIILILSIGFAQNIFLTSEFLGPITSPDTNEEFYKLTTFIEENSLIEPIYVTSEAIDLYSNSLNKKEIIYVGQYQSEWEEVEKNIAPNQDYSIIIWNIPKKELIETFSQKEKCEKVWESKNDRLTFSAGYTCQNS